MQLIDCTNYKIVVFRSQLTLIEHTDLLSSHPQGDLIYVALDGCNDESIPKEQLLVKNSKSSFLNHMMWEGLLDDQEQLDYIEKCCERLYNTGKQMLIEDYAFQEQEAFYDYSK